MIGHLLTALQYWDEAHKPICMAMGLAYSGRAPKAEELQDAAWRLRRAADELEKALKPSNVYPLNSRPAAMKLIGDALPEHIVALFDKDTLIPSMPINGGEEPVNPEPPEAA